MTGGVKVIYSAHAREDLMRLDKPVAKRVALKVKSNSEMENPLSRAKKLTGVLAGLYRYRIGDYRVIFDFKNNKLAILTVLRVKHRKEVYE